MSPALTRLMLALRDELSDWAAASERLETVIGDALDGRRLEAQQMAAVQSLDGLSQHLRQLSQLCGDLGQGTGDEAEARIAAAVGRLNLGDLGRRLEGAAGTEMQASAGEAELW